MTMNQSIVSTITTCATSLALFLRVVPAQADYLHTASGDNKFSATVKLESDPNSTTGISATPQGFDDYYGTGNQAGEWEYDSKALIRVIALNPKSDSQYYRDSVTLSIQGLTNSPDYTPSGKGNIHPGGNWPLDNKWLYGAFTEPKSAWNAQRKNVVIVAKYDGVRISRPLRLAVIPFFFFLTKLHQNGPAGPEPYTHGYAGEHDPSDGDYETAWRYAKWKYGINTSNISPRLSRSLSQKGLTLPNSDPALKWPSTTLLGISAFTTEHGCAGTLGHENVHGGQSIALRTQEFPAEKEAYQWEIANFGILHYDELEQADTLAWYNYYSGKGPKPG